MERRPLRLEARLEGGDWHAIAPGDRWGPPWSTTWIRVRGSAPSARPGFRPVVLVDLGYQAATGFTCEALAWRDGRPWRGVDPNHRWLPVPGGDVDLLLEAAANPAGSVGGAGRARSMIALRDSDEPAFVLGAVESALLDEAAYARELDAKVGRELPAQRAAGPRAFVVATGHAHIDTAWLWPVREAVRKVARSWSTQLALMDEYPEHRFAASHSAHYAWMQERYPDLFARVKQLVAEGRWEPVGAMFVEADVNLPAGESLVRQVLHGQRYWEREFGRRSAIGWLPDGFGFPASLPQILAGGGVSFFLTQKLSWNQLNKPPHHTFRWEGLDGTRLVAHFPPADTYNGSFDVSELLASAREPRSLYLFGHGDGGGGPEPDMLELARRLADVEGLPRVELGSAQGFFESLGGDLPVWSGELYFELHRGTYTSQARTKRLHRQAEEALRAAELWSVAAGAGYPAARLDELWRGLLLNEFHDILPGSSIDWVYEDAERELREVRDGARELAERAGVAAAGAGDTPTVFNSTGHARREVVGESVVDVPACGWAPLVPVPTAERVEASGTHLENALLRVEWDASGRLTRVFDKPARREVLAGPGNQLWLYRDEPALWDAWDLDPGYEADGVELTALGELAVVRSSGVRGEVLMTRSSAASEIRQWVSLDAGSRVIRFRTDVSWHEEHKVLRALFPVSVRSPRATFEIQFGHIERPTHRNTSWDVAKFEVCAHRWMDLGEAGYGVALLNDCKYGHSALGSELGITLLRAPLHPDPTADQGAQRFTYALLPHPGDFREAGVIQAAEDLNSPLRLLRTGAAGPRSLIEVDNPQVAIAAVKRAEDSDAVIVRVYESWGGAARARLRTSFPITRATRTNLLEEEIGEIAAAGDTIEVELRAFEIATLKLER